MYVCYYSSAIAFYYTLSRESNIFLVQQFQMKKEKEKMGSENGVPTLFFIHQGDIRFFSRKYFVDPTAMEEIACPCVTQKI